MLRRTEEEVGRYNFMEIEMMGVGNTTFKRTELNTAQVLRVRPRMYGNTKAYKEKSDSDELRCSTPSSAYIEKLVMVFVKRFLANKDLLQSFG